MPRSVWQTGATSVRTAVAARCAASARIVECGVSVGVAIILWTALQLCVATPSGAAVRTSRFIDFPPSRYGPEVPLAELVGDSSLQVTEDGRLANARLVIVKSTYELRLFVGERMVKIYRAQFGKHFVGRKTRKGDGKTPEGTYRICGRNRGSKYYLSLQIDYPNEEDIARALEGKAITVSEAERLRAELAAGGCPKVRTRLGGDIFIHGQHPGTTRDIRREGRKRSERKDLQPGDQDPGAMSSGYNWTLGCIGLTNPDIRELFHFIADGTVVEILP